MIIENSSKLKEKISCEIYWYGYVSVWGIVVVV